MASTDDALIFICRAYTARHTQMFNEWKLRTCRGELAQEDSQESFPTLSFAADERFEFNSDTDLPGVYAESLRSTDSAAALMDGEVQPSKKRRGNAQPQQQPQMTDHLAVAMQGGYATMSVGYQVTPVSTMLPGSGGRMRVTLPDMALDQRIMVALTWAGF